MNYYVMVGEGKYPIMPIQSGPEIEGNWHMGKFIADPIPQLLTYILDADYEGFPKPMYYEKAIPVMRDDVAEVLTRAGVDNIQYFDAVLVNPSDGTRHANYKAYNIVGLVACANKEASKTIESISMAPGGDFFESLVIDESKTEGKLLFRMAENISAIVVHERVKDAIEHSAIPGFVFYGPGEWSG